MIQTKINFVSAPSFDTLPVHNIIEINKNGQKPVFKKLVFWKTSSVTVYQLVQTLVSKIAEPKDFRGGTIRSSKRKNVKMIFQECGVLSGYLYFIQRIAFDHGHIFKFYLKFMMWTDLHQNLDEVVYLVILGLCLTQICWWFKISLVDYSLICNPQINFKNELLSKFDADFALFWYYFFKN